MTLNELDSVQERRVAQAEAESQAEVDRFMSRHGLVRYPRRQT